MRAAEASAKSFSNGGIKKAEKNKVLQKHKEKEDVFCGLEQVQKKKKQEKLGGLCSGDASRGGGGGERRAC